MKQHPNANMIPEKAIVKIYYKNGEVGNYGTIEKLDLVRMLRGYTYDKEFEMWFDKKADNAYDVKAI